MRIFLDCDVGNGTPGADIDDGVALALALRSPEVHLEGVSLVAGNVPVDEGVENTLALLAAAGDDDLPVYRGASAPLVQDPAAWRACLQAWFDEPEVRALWPTRRWAGRRAASVRRAADALVETVAVHPGEVTIVATGPLTNIATALRLAPALASQVARIIIMGGAIGTTPAAEFNVAYDPEAASIVLASGAPITLIPLNVTVRTILRAEQNARLLASADPLVRAVAGTVEPWIRRFAARRVCDGATLHDALAVAVAIDPSLVTTRPHRVAIELRGEYTRGWSVAWPIEPSFFPSPPPGPAAAVDLATDVAVDRFMAFLLQRLNAPAPAHMATPITGY